MSEFSTIRRVDTPVLSVAFEEHGPADGEAAILLHGFPYDPRCYDAMVPLLVGRGLRVIVPYLRGYGSTCFLSDATMRSGQQAALGQDLLDFMDALRIGKASLVGYDWGGRAACIVAALRPERVRCLVTGEGYNIQDIAAAGEPKAPEDERRNWYQYYFHSPRGRAGLDRNRREMGELLWRLWSPSWRFDGATYAATAKSFDNADFVDVVVHSYRHRYGYAEGDPAYEAMERALAAQPKIAVPAISLCGADDGVGPPPAQDEDAGQFTGSYERRVLPGVGHDIPQEAPEETARALFDLLDAKP